MNLSCFLVFNLGNPNEAFLEVTCNSLSMEQSEPIEFQWNKVQGVDLSEEKISAKIVKLTLNRCPAVLNVISFTFIIIIQILIL